MRVRAAAAEIAAQARFVHINHDKIAPYAAWLLETYPLVEKMDDLTHFVDLNNKEKTAAYLLALDSINFGSGYFALARRAGLALEYEVIAKGLKQCFLGNLLDTPEKWRHAEPADFHAATGIPAGAHEALDRLMFLFAAHLQQTGRHMQAYNDSVLELLSAAGGSAYALAEIVSAWDNFADEPLFKRAQILAADMHLALGGLAEMEKLTIFADNMVPHVLRCDGVLLYDSGLAARIDAGIMIDSGSREELELRGVAIHAVELMHEAVGNRVTSVNFDHILWHRGYEPAIYARPTHQTMSVWY